MTTRNMSAARQEPGYRGWPAPPDPGDLSRRVALRRAELRLTREQVAQRARISPRYMEYLESFPSVPDAATLRQLATALRTTSAALLGAGAQAPDGHAPPPARPVFSRLSPAECLRLIRGGGVGRIAFDTAGGPAVVPVNFAFAEGTIVLRTEEGTVIGAHGEDKVAFEVDHIDEALSQGWSVLIRGQAHRVLQPFELRHLRETVTVVPWADGERDSYIRIVPREITGRRIEAG